ncbi:hypothetical protein [Sulfurospirillum multivorans]|uniref:Uncharacterized protein n=2 Tax=Sulfurospirillum multivorans TaxID=66821 RepID=A0AA86DZ49_SULMK|nr:hypothetical protein [Sulfurospirillum multivorans]AHJ13983.1 hypothetical protein SMUL_2744 [Sulfurospirillum multivorans DSM 12446]QEH07471.1 hypothetical protein SMN_2716 [Sulfurospirillum multivorans]
MKLIHFSDTHFGFNDLDTLSRAGIRSCNLKPQIHFTHIKTLILEYYLLFFIAILKTLSEVFKSQDKNRCKEILEAFHPMKNNTGRKP